MSSMFWVLISGDVPDPDGSHKHKCNYCWTVWEHSNQRAGDHDSHCCPHCDRELAPPWFQHDGNEPPDYIEDEDGMMFAA